MAWSLNLTTTDLEGKMRKIIICIDCGEEKEHGGKGLCRSCYNRNYHSRNCEEINANRRRYYAKDLEHREKIVEQVRLYRLGNPEKVAECRKRHYYEHREEILEKNRVYYQNHKEYFLRCSYEWHYKNRQKAAIIQRRWNEKNRERINAYMRIYNAHRRAKKANADGHATKKQIMLKVEYYGGLCYLCGKPYEEIDHVIPLSKGGTDWPANLRPICKSCNSSKKDKLLKELDLLIPKWEREKSLFYISRNS